MRVTNFKWMSLVALLVVAAMSASCAGGAGVTTGPALTFRPGTSNNDVDGGATTIGTGNGGNSSGGGSLDTDLNLPGGGGGSTTPSGNAFTPAITVPATESFANDAEPGEDDVTAWVKNCFETLPQGRSGVFQNASLQGWALAIFDETNRVRAANGLAPMEYEMHLEALAQAHARDMGLRDYFSHDCPDGVLMWDRWMAMRIPYAEWAGENAAMGQETAREVVEQWMQSPGHRKNMLHTSAAYCGVGVYFDASDRDMPLKIIMEYADFRDDPATNDWYQFGDVYRQ
jgi:uncharacterized protein YkwD